MSSLTAEQVTELTERINARFAEFNVGEMRVFEPVTPGVARLAFDVVEEWTAQAAAGKYLAYERAVEDECGDGGEYSAYFVNTWNQGYERGREAMRAELGYLEKAGGWEVPHTNGNGHHADPDQIRADIKDLGAAYPSLEDEPNGKDIFDGVHPVTGGPEPEPIIGYDETPTVMDAETFNAMKDKLGLSPATVATLGPEHTVVTPLGTRRSGALSEVDEAALSRTRMSKDELSADLRMTIHALQDMAVDGEMPSMNDWLLNRPAGMMTAQGIQKRHNLVWSELAEYAKLKLKGKRGGRQ